MSSKTHFFRIGLFVLFGAILLIGALFAMGLKSYLGQNDTFETYVPGKVENLSVGALVKLRGVTIGKVSSIDFAGAEYPGMDEQFVVIRFQVPKDTYWSAETNNVQALLDQEAGKGLRVRVQGQGFLGANILALEYVDPRVYPAEQISFSPKHYYIPSAPSQITRVLGSLEKTLRQVEDLDLAELMTKAQTLIDSANKLLASVDQVDFKELGTNASALLANANQIDFKNIGTNAAALIVEFRETNRRLQTTLKDVDLPGLGRDTVALEAKLSAAAAQLRHLLANVDTGELNGSLANIRTATDELIVLLHNLEQRPSSVLFSKPPQPVSELDKPPKQ